MEARGEFAKDGVYDTCYKWRAEFQYADGTKLIFATPAEAAAYAGVRHAIACASGTETSNPSSPVYPDRDTQMSPITR